MKLCGLYIRVSTDRQAKVEEGSLRNQDHLLTQHVEMKNKLGQGQWEIVERYVDEGRSAKDTNRSAYQRMIQDVKDGRINTVLCLALSRISRSTRDLLEMVEFFGQQGVGFICLKEDYDTTTPQGRLLLTLMGGLNQFEREQTAERTRAAFLARAERGLWNGGYVFGYDLDPARKGYLMVNEQEAVVVNFAFDAYLRTGSVIRTLHTLNSAGYRTKAYNSRRGKMRPAAPFSHGGVYQLLKNWAYIGKKEINKKFIQQDQAKLPEEQRYRTVEAVWPAIVPEEKFYKAQKLLQQNSETHNNNASPTKHFYLLNGGVLHCHRCGGQMEGRNGHGHKGQKVYYYYFCKNTSCRFKLPQVEIENTCAALMGTVAQDDRVLPRIVAKFNQRLKTCQPRLASERWRLESELRQVNAEAQILLGKVEGLEEARIFAQERLRELADKRRHIEAELERIRLQMADLTSQEVDEIAIRRMLQDCQVIFTQEMQPFKRKELLRASIQRIELSDKECRAAVKLGSATLSSDRLSGANSFPHTDRGATYWGRALRPPSSKCSWGSGREGSPAGREKTSLLFWLDRKKENLWLFEFAVEHP